MADIAAALARLVQGGSPLLLKEKSVDATSHTAESRAAPAFAAPPEGAERLSEEDTDTYSKSATRMA